MNITDGLIEIDYNRARIEKTYINKRSIQTSIKSASHYTVLATDSTLYSPTVQIKKIEETMTVIDFILDAYDPPKLSPNFLMNPNSDLVYHSRI